MRNDDLIDFKLYVRLIILELKLMVWPSLPKSRRTCTNMTHLFGLFRPS